MFHLVNSFIVLLREKVEANFISGTFALGAKITGNLIKWNKYYWLQGGTKQKEKPLITQSRRCSEYTTTCKALSWSDKR
jgi:hypothetical protein